MESAYLKNAVGTVLAKAMAETVAAQPSNPQEYLALYLLHHIQQEERRSTEAARRRKAAAMRTEWGQRRALQEKAAVDTIERGFRHFRERLRRRKEEEQQLQQLYEEAEEEAAGLLDQEAANRRQVMDREEQEDERELGSGTESKTALQTLRQKAEEMEEAYDEFYKSQRFMLNLQKHHLGVLKQELLSNADRVRAAADATQMLRDDAVVAEEELQQGATRGVDDASARLGAAAADLAARLHTERDHSHISVNHVLYRVLRSLCYLLYNATPSATDSATKVAALLKPAVVVQLLRGFNPVATYDKHRPLRLERALQQGEDGEDDNAGATLQHGGAAGGEEDEEGIPIPQPRTRQVRRVQRVMRSCMLDGEYICELHPNDFFDEDDVAEDAQLQSDVAAADAAQARAKEIREGVEAQVKQRGGVVLWALLRFLRAATRYRTARDAWLTYRREVGLSQVPASHEPAEPEEEDENNDETLFDDEGEVDFVAVQRLQDRIGVDVDESLAKLWEGKDERRRRVLQERADAMRRRAEAEDADEELGEDEG